MKTNVKSQLPIIFSVSGGLLLTLLLILSETLYADTEEFYLMPLWYRICFIPAAVISVTGIILSIIFRTRDNTSDKMLYVCISCSAGFMVISFIFIAFDNLPFSGIVFCTSFGLGITSVLLLISEAIGRSKKVKLPKYVRTADDIAYDRVWELYAKQSLGEEEDAICDYDAHVNGEGHWGYFDSNENELDRTLPILYRLLPDNLRENLERAVNAYKAGEESLDELSPDVDKYFYDHEDQVIKIITEMGKRIMERESNDKH